MTKEVQGLLRFSSFGLCQPVLQGELLPVKRQNLNCEYLFQRFHLQEYVSMEPLSDVDTVALNAFLEALPN